MSRYHWLLFAICAIGLGGYLFATQPAALPVSALSDQDGVMLVGHAPDGERFFHAAGCASCHATDGTDALAGGKAFVTE
ncbi:hypothetical protein N9V68_00280, partial [Octadecabacter sp.]|nr:hypothetical protein [Octadecabacter sp.]